MNRMKTLTTTLGAALCLIIAAQTVWASDVRPNKRRGQVYYRMVCTECHVTATGKPIAPMDQTMDEWRQYLDTDKHDATGATNPSARFYMSRAYREEIKDSNKAAKKFLKLQDDQIYQDVRAFVISGAKDSDTPASCN